MAKKFIYDVKEGVTKEFVEDNTCPECLGNGYDLDGPQEDDSMEDCPACSGTGTTDGEDWYPKGH